MRSPHRHSAGGGGDRLTTFILLILGCYLAVATFGLVLALSVSDSSGGIGAERYEPLHFELLTHGSAAILTLIYALRLRRNSTPSIRRARFALLSAILIAVISSDRLMGVLYPPPHPAESILQTHATRGWTQRPLGEETPGHIHAGWQHIRIDQFGFRVGPGDEHRDLSGRKRILFLGDSVTFGLGVEADATFPARTCSILNSRHANLNCVDLNSGTVGYDTLQEYDLLDEIGFSLDPDLVVVGICLNDVTQQFETTGQLELDVEPHAYWSGWVRAATSWRNTSYDRELLQRAGRQTEALLLRELIHAGPNPRMEAAWHAMETALGKIDNACRAHAVPLLVVCFPIQVQLWDVVAPSAPQERLKRFTESKEIKFLDLLPAFQKAGSPGEERARKLIIDETHPTTAGDAIAAERIADMIESARLGTRLWGDGSQIAH